MNTESLLQQLFKEYFGHLPEITEALPPSGSYRRYYRLKSSSNTAIGAYNEDLKENIAFVEYSKHFKSKAIHVPKVYKQDLDHHVYLLEDLGDTSLLQFIQSNSDEEKINDSIRNVYKKTIDELCKVQVLGYQQLDFSVAYPRKEFDKQSMMWDLNYFKYYFLKLAKVPFNEQELEDDFETFSNFLLEADRNYFMFRDFQSRNIMIHENKPYLIDYQGGRKGALQYDLASLLFEAKTALPEAFRNELKDIYLQEINRYTKVDHVEFNKYFGGFVMIRLMQAMGAYGFRGLYEKKELFLQSIPPAIEHLKWLIKNIEIPLSIPQLRKVWEYLASEPSIKDLYIQKKQLKVGINSFSFRRGVPVDESNNGGGYVFDCRAIHNPGRYEQYKKLTGKDKEVIDFLDNEPEMEFFLQHITPLCCMSIENYLKRGFTNLMINFGCTGGQHRSVYAAETIFRKLKNQYPQIEVSIRHREQELIK